MLFNCASASEHAGALALLFFTTCPHIRHCAHPCFAAPAAGSTPAPGEIRPAHHAIVCACMCLVYVLCWHASCCLSCSAQRLSRCRKFFFGCVAAHFAGCGRRRHHPALLHAAALGIDRCLPPTPRCLHLLLSARPNSTSRHITVVRSLPSRRLPPPPASRPRLCHRTHWQRARWQAAASRHGHAPR